jgi:hypothetical protein
VPPDQGFSQRAVELAEDLLAELDSELHARNRDTLTVHFRLDGTHDELTRESAREWIMASADSGFPDVRYYIESLDDSAIRVNLAAFEDPDRQFHE